MWLWARLQGFGEAVQSGIVRWQSESQEIVGPIEAAAPDVVTGKGRVEQPRFGMPRQPKQCGSTRDRPSRPGKNRIQLLGLTFQRGARAAGPRSVQQRGAADGKRRPRTGPWTERGSDGFSD